jgi:predicted dehydrogenase
MSGLLKNSAGTGKLKVAVIGFGFMGRTHARNIVASEYMELSAIVESNPDAFSKMTGNIDTGEIPSKILSEINKYSDPEICFKKEKLDAVFICVHTLLHYEIAMKALKRDLHVFVEKPFVFNLTQGQELIEEALSRNKILAVGQVVRYMPAYEKLNEIYKSKEYGNLRFISMTRFTGTPSWGSWSDVKKDFGSSGGALFDLSVHDIDFMQYMLGLPSGINAICLPGPLSVYDYICAVWDYKSRDIFVKIEGGLSFHTKFPFEATFKCEFDKASVSWTSANNTEMLIADNEALKTEKLDDINAGYKTEDELFARSIIENKAYICTAESALETIKLCYRHFE